MNEPNAQHTNGETVTPRRLQLTRTQVFGVILWGYFEVGLILLMRITEDLSRGSDGWRHLDEVLMYLGFVGVSLFLPCIYLLRPPSTLRATLRFLCLVFVVLSLIPLGYALSYTLPSTNSLAHNIFTRDPYPSRNLSNDLMFGISSLLWSLGGVLVRIGLLPSLLPRAERNRLSDSPR